MNHHPEQQQKFRRTWLMRYWWVFINIAAIVRHRYCAAKTATSTRRTKRQQHVVVGMRRQQSTRRWSSTSTLMPSSIAFIHPPEWNNLLLQQCKSDKSLIHSDKTSSNIGNSSDILNNFSVDTGLSYESLEHIYRFRGAVDTGYGRGGKKLGFPTANLGPASFFHNTALQNMSTGVYFGYARIEDNLPSTGNSRNAIIHKAVVNIGYSPTFAGEENKVKIIEAHLIDPSQKNVPSDFYFQIMRLQLIGYIRPEMKFESFPDLIQQINNDVQTADQLLSVAAYNFTSYQSDPFLLHDEIPWIGTGGGNATASWEVQ